MPVATLTAIRNKVRRLTRSISVSQLSNADLDEYINTAYVYDMPENLRLFTQRRTLTFYTQPNVDVYATNAIANNPLNNFRNVNITIHGPVYVAGYPVMLSESREQFFNIFPKNQSVVDTGLRGNGVLAAFNGTIGGIGGVSSNAILPKSVTFNSIGANNVGLVVKDEPTNNQQGNLVVPNITGVVLGTINYLTGVWNINFALAVPAVPVPLNNEPINVEYVVYQPSRPQAVLFYENQFTLRPVPDQVYPVEMEAYVRPADLADPANPTPELEQWWQYISYLAAKKIFEDRMDMDSIQMIMPELKNQERLVLRRTLVQNANKRASTIYTNQVELGGARGWNYWGLY